MSHKIKLAKTGKKNEIKQLGSIRIIAGNWRGRKLPVHDLQGLRPTTDRVKETLFNWLSPYIVNSRCLDLFTGSGSLSFEALSRGAAEVAMVELDKQAAQQLKHNLNLLKSGNAQVHNQSALDYLSKEASGFDLVFIDPPFRQNLLQPSCQLLSQSTWLNANALIYIEREKELQLDELPQSWQLLKSKTAGQVIFELYQYIP